MIPDSSSQNKSGFFRSHWVLLLLLVLSAAGTLQYMWPRDADVAALLRSSFPHSQSKPFHSSLQDFQRVTADFGFQRVVLIGMVAPTGKNALSKEMIQANKWLSERLKVLPSVQSVLSLATTPTIKGGGTGLNVRDIFPADLTTYTAKQQKRLTQSLLRDPLLAGNLLSEDGKATLVLCTFQENQSRAGMKATLRTLRKAQTRHPSLRFGINGLPAVKSMLPSALKGRPLWFVLLGVLLFLVAVAARLRDPRLLLWCMTTTGFATLVGAVPLVLLFGFSPAGPLLLAVASLSLSLSWASSASADGLPSPWRFLRAAGTPMLWLALGVAFAALGLFLSWKLLLVLGVSVLLAPAAVALCGHLGRLTPLAEGALPPEEAGFCWKRSLAGVTLSLLVGALGFSSLSSGRDVASFLPGPPLLVRGNQILNQHFGGATPLLLHFQGNLRNPQTLKAIDRLGRRLEAHVGIQRPQSIAFLIRHLNYLMTGTPRVPDTAGKISAMWSLMDGQAALKSLVRNRGKAGILQARVVLQRRWTRGCGGRPWATPCLTREPSSLVHAIDKLMKDLPRKSQPLRWAKATPSQRGTLLNQRAAWVAEGLDLWLHRTTGSWLKERRSLLRARLLRALKDWTQNKNTPSLSNERWRKVLVPYLKSEDCDLELNKSQQELVLKALLQAFSRPSFSFTRPSIKKVLTDALEGTEPGKDKGGLKYAAKSLFQKKREASRTLQLDAWVLDTQKWLTKGASASLREALQKAWRPRTLALAEFRAALMELQNPHWVLSHHGNTQLNARHAGLHKLLMPVASLSRSLSMTLPWLFLLCFFVVGRLRSSSWEVSLRRYLPVLCVTLCLMGVAGLLRWPLDLGLLCALMAIQLLCAQWAWSTHEGPSLTSALLLFLPSLAFSFSGIPLLAQTGMLVCLGVLLSLLWLKWLSNPKGPLPASSATLH